MQPNVLFLCLDGNADAYAILFIRWVIDVPLFMFHWAFIRTFNAIGMKK